MNKTLFVAQFNEINSYNSLSLSRQIQKNNLFCLFNDYKSYELYNKVIMNDNNQSITINNRDLKIINMFEDKKAYSYFVFFHYTEIVFDEQKIAEIANHITKDAVGLYLENKHMLTIVKYEHIVDLNRNGCSYKNLFNDIKNINFKKQNVGSDIIDHKNIPDIINYEDDNCLFALFDGRQDFGIVQSYCYFNKNNQKIYNIKNNILGTILEHKKDNIVIEWNLDNINTVCSYTNENGYFIWIKYGQNCSTKFSNILNLMCITKLVNRAKYYIGAFSHGNTTSKW